MQQPPPVVPLPVVPAAAAVPPVFFRGPGEVIDANAPQFIDYTIESNKKAYKYAVSGLSEKFDLTPSKLQIFLNRVNERVARTELARNY
jgi:hypothetical protein